ncbi:MAG: 2-iminobutanoate/2-iminopropanoate deaminase [Candidatus Atribacteria bacterium]|nr:2-iminobutanoate/2-iminopropanoate deaminase [Candidatus Atribacteria bacterium]
MIKRISNLEKAPRAKGPYSIVVESSNLVFVSGQGPMDPNKEDFVKGFVEEEAKQAFNNVRVILESIGLSIGNIVKVTLYLSNMDDYEVVNKVYAEFFGPFYPARTCVEVRRLPFDTKIEIDVVASRES